VVLKTGSIAWDVGWENGVGSIKEESGSIEKETG
jgi:hypothetical protein